jgi:hypothetical protein
LKRLITILICGLSVAFSSTYAAEVVQVDAASRNVINTGNINFATNQLRIGGIVVGPGGGGGGGGIGAISLELPISLFQSPVTFTVDSSGTAVGTATFTNVPGSSVFANVSPSSTVPAWTGFPSLKTAMSLGNVENTADADKPVSIATQTALDLKADTSTMTTALGLKADTTALTAGLALKEDLLPTTSVNGYILSRQTSGAYAWVDPVTLGTTSYNGTDGVSNGTTTYTSATAAFVAGDVGLTITGTDIPAGTTIASRTNATTVELSQAATGSHTGNSFTIVNRLLPAGGTGTVTTFSAGNLATLVGSPATLFTTSVSNASTTPALSFTMTPASINTFFGNSGSGVGYMSASAARTSLGGTTVGQNIFQLSNPSAIRFIKINADNTVTAESAATHLTSIGGESPLTFSAPLSRTTNTVSITTANASNGGAVTTTDWNHFQSGYSASPQTILASTCTGTNPCVLDLSSPLANPRINQVLLDFQLNHPLRIVLPAATNYGAAWAYEPIEILDIVGGTAQTDFGITVRRSVSDTIDGSSSDLTLPRGVTYSRLTPNGVASWTSTYYYVNSVKDPVDRTKTFAFDATLQTPGTPGVITAAAGPSVTVNATETTGGPDNTLGVIQNINSAGAADKRQVSPYQLLPIEYPIGTVTDGVPDAISGTSSTVTDNDPGTYDKVPIVGALQGPFTIVWPSASKYQAGQELTLVDVAGTVGNANIVTVTHPVGSTDKFSGQDSFSFDEQYGRRILTSDGDRNWTVSSTKTAVQPYTVLAPGGASNNTYTISGGQTAVKHNGHINLVAGVNNLAVTSPYDGMSIELVLVQPSSAATLNLPAGSKVSGTGAGVVTLSSGGSKIDRLRGVYDGGISTFLWEPPLLDHTAATPPTGPSALSLGTITSNSMILSWTDNSNNETAFEVFRALGNNQTTGFTKVAEVGANVVTYTDSGLTPSTFYTYKVRATNSSGTPSGFTTAQSAQTLSGSPTAELLENHFNDGATLPNSLQATGTVGGNMTLTLPHWTTTSLQNGANSVAAWAPLAGMSAPTGTSSSAPVGGTSTVHWRYRVMGFKNSGTHSLGTEVEITTGVATLNSGTYNHIVWNAVTGADYYEVYRVSPTSGTEPPVRTPSDTGRIGTNITALTFDDTGITGGLGTPPLNVTTDESQVSSNGLVNYAAAPNGPANIVTVTFWVKATFTASGTNKLVSLSGGGATNAISVTNPGAKLTVSISGNTGVFTGTVSLAQDPASTGNNINSGTGWHLVTVVMDNSLSGNTPSSVGVTQAGSSDTIRVYFDGNNQVPFTTTVVSRSGAKVFPTQKVVVGVSAFGGFIDDLRIYDHALTTGGGGTIQGVFNGNAQ